MLRRFSKLFSYLLLVLMPLQALATANMLICNSVMQSQFETQVETQANVQLQAAFETQSAKVMPCHQPMTNLSNVDQINTHDKMHGESKESPCKANCASICANMCAVTAIPNTIQSSFSLNLTQLFSINSQPYASIIQPNLQRPPITFI